MPFFRALKWNRALKEPHFFWPEEGQPQLQAERFTVGFAGRSVCHGRCVRRCLGGAGWAATGCGGARCRADACLTGARGKPLPQVQEPQTVSCLRAPSTPRQVLSEIGKFRGFGVDSLSSLSDALVNLFFPFGYLVPYVFTYLLCLPPTPGEGGGEGADCAPG